MQRFFVARSAPSEARAMSCMASGVNVAWLRPARSSCALMFGGPLGLPDRGLFSIPSLQGPSASGPLQAPRPPDPELLHTC